MTYRVVKTINGRQYVYEQTSYRVGKKVKTKCVYLGPVGGRELRDSAPDFDVKREMEVQAIERAAEKERMERFTAEVGLKVGPEASNPVEKSSSQSPDTAPASPEASE